VSGPRVVSVSGTATGRWEPIADVFARLLAGLGDDCGAALCVYADGRPVVDLVGGAYRADTTQVLFSVSKAITTVAVATAVARGELDLDEPLARYWPEFDRPSTRDISLRTVLSHRSGIAGLTAPVTFDELRAGRDLELVAREEPAWTPGTDQGYHAFTFGSLVDGAVRHRLGRTVADLVRERVARPLGLDLWIGTPCAEHARIAPVVAAEPRITPRAASRPDSATRPDTAFGALFAVDDVFNTAEFREAAWPALSGVADARSLARMMAATLTPVDGHQLMPDDVRADLVAPRSTGIDRGFGVSMNIGTGFQLPFPQLPMLGPRSYGHEGAGGSVVVADPDDGIAMAFTTNSFGHMTGASLEALAMLGSVHYCSGQPERGTLREALTAPTGRNGVLV
jgi:CubicO group peptidase (beta-lactamase class C family)